MLPQRRFWAAIAAAVALVSTLLVGPAPASGFSEPGTQVFVNEIHYDNDGTDVGEFVEIAGPAGTDLTGWSVELYNGSATQLNVYDTIALSGTIDDEGTGTGAVSFAQAGIQNGAPDGLALVDASGTVVQFLSYEGTFTPTSGPASGVLSTDIGVAEPGAAGESLQLTGTGVNYDGFTWTGPVAESPGSLNTDQDFSLTPPPADPPFISEIHYDNDGTDVGEFVEIEGPAGTDLTGWTIELYNGSATQLNVYDTIALSGTIDDEGTGTGAVSFAQAGIQNGAPDGLALVDPTGTVIEFLSYEGTFTPTSGAASGVLSTDIGVAEPGAIGESLQLVSGTWTGPVAESPGTLNVAAPEPPPALFFSEIHYDNDGGDVGEFFEVQGPAGTDLTGWTVELYNGSAPTAATVYDTINLTGTIDDEDGTSGAVDVQLPANGLQNGAPDGLALIAPDGTVVEFLSYEGTLTGASGTSAEGLTSTDIGVAESNATPIGESLQLIDGTWTGPAPQSPGDLNGATPPGGGLPFPFVEDFTTDCEANGWTIVSADADAADTWTCSTTFNNADVNAFGGSAPADDWFISPGFDMEAQADETLEFVSWNNFTDSGQPHPQLSVLWSSDYSGSGDPSVATWTPLTGITFPAPDTETETDSGTIDLTGISGSNVYFAFRYQSSGNGGGSSTNWRVSDIEFGPIATEPATPAKIHEVQGTGATVAITTPVEIQAVVTSLFEDDDVLDGFFVQEEEADYDTNDATSEGIFVFCRGACPSSLSVGDLVTVVGTPTEFLQMSQIDARDGSITVDGTAALPAAVTVDLPAADGTNVEATFEATEAMIVTIPQELFVSEYFELARFGEIVLTQGGVPYQFTDDNAPSVAGYATFLDDLATKRIILDDGNSDQNDAIFGPAADEAYPWPVGGLSTANFLRGGDSITGLTGVLQWGRQGRGTSDASLELAWRIQTIQDDAFDYTFTANSARPATPPDVGGTLKVASFNVLNYFLTLDDGSTFCDFACRGADSEAERIRQRDKIVTALAALDADVVGLIEIENDDDLALAELTSALNDVAGAGTYDFVATGVIGTDAIKVAFIYKPATVSTVGAHAILDSSIDPNFIDTKNRPVLIQTFSENASGEVFTAAVNHLKSKGSSCADVGDPEPLDGQASCAQTRTAAAQALADYLATDPTGSGDPDFLILGDLNAYAKEDPIVALENAGYTNLIDAFVGDSAYSFLFDGQRGYLDYAMANAQLLGQVSGAGEWNINADEIPLLDYNDAIQDTPAEASFERESGATTLYDTSAYRSSDHDPVIVGLSLGDGSNDPVYECGDVSGTEAQLVALGYNVVIGDDSANFLKGTSRA